MPATRTVRIGIHARNDYTFTKGDYQLIREAKIETIKMMSFTEISVYERLRRENPDLDFIVRLFDEKMGVNSHPTSQEFAEKFVPIMNKLRPFATKFEIHNEPNIRERYEGWGAEDSDARDFRQWFVEVYSRLKAACPWAKLGFPGLAVPHIHRDLEWLDICREAIEKADWLGVHCYWQTPPDRSDQRNNHLSDLWGLRFKEYHERFPNKVIEITEFGNSNGQSGLSLSSEEMVRQYTEYYQELYKYHYLGSASAFIASSPDPIWEQQGFVWLKRSGEKLPVIEAVGAIPRPRLVKVVLLPEYGVEYVSQIVPRGIKAGQRARASFVLRNVGRKTWVAKGPNRMQLGYHWFTPEGQLVPAAEDLRMSLPRDIATGQAVELTNVKISAPYEAGNYVLQWDLVEEGITWFSNRGAKTFGVGIKVEAAPPGEKFFPETERTVKGLFLDFFNRYGLDICGYPITEEFRENGVPSQYFQRVALEEYEPDKIRLKLVGTEALTSRRTIAEWQKKAEGLQEEVNELEAKLEEQRMAHPPSITVVPSGAVVPKPKMENTIDALPKHPTNRYQTRALESIKYLVIHHTAVPPSVGTERIAQYHVDKKDWPGIGYHFFVAADGTIYQTNELTTISYHAQQVNPTSVGICLAGNFTDEIPTAAQLDSAAELCAYLLGELKLRVESVKGHKEFVSTQCPGAQWDGGQTWRNTFFERIEAVQTRAQAVPGARLKSIGHYVLFWQYPDDWARKDWESAVNYIGRFRPTCGFSMDDAMAAEFVTIIGGPQGVPVEVEQQLKNAGCKVERVAGEDAEETKRILDEMAEKGQRFRTFSL